MEVYKKYNPNIHHRQSIRLNGYDYAQEGNYFITLCTHNRECLFGEITNGDELDFEMQLNDYGRIVQLEWLKTPEIRSEIQLQEFVIMPNHFHAIVTYTGDQCTGDRPVTPTGHIHHFCTGDRPVAPTGPKSKSIGALMAGFKSAVTKRINELRKTPKSPIWQRNYYEHIIRNESDYFRIAEYILNNPQRWSKDTLNPDSQ